MTTQPNPHPLTRAFYEGLARRAALQGAQAGDDFMRNYWARMERKALRLARTVRRERAQ